MQNIENTVNPALIPLTEEMMEEMKSESEKQHAETPEKPLHSELDAMDSDFEDWFTDSRPGNLRLREAYISSRELLANREKIRHFNDSKYKTSIPSRDDYEITYEVPGEFKTKPVNEFELNKMLADLGTANTFTVSDSARVKTKPYNLNVILPTGENLSDDEEIGYIIEFQPAGSKAFELRRLMKDGKIHYLSNCFGDTRTAPKPRNFFYNHKTFGRIEHRNAIVIRRGDEKTDLLSLSGDCIKAVYTIKGRKASYN